MMHEQDVEVIKQFLGCDIIPANVENEYYLWKHMKDRVSPGPLGMELCVALLRRINQEAPPRSLFPDVVNWRQVPKDTLVRFIYEGKEMEGKFKGICDPGTIQVLFPNGYVEEVTTANADVVRAENAIARDEPKAKSEDKVIDAMDSPSVDWKTVDAGTEVMVVDRDDVGKFVKLSRGKVVCDFDGEEVKASPDDVVPALAIK